jgi:hypothetical protein
MSKMTKAQRAVLERLASGDEIWTTSGRHAGCFWHGALMDRSPGFATVHALQKAGLIVNKATKKYQGSEYVITDLGRSALGEQPEVKE